MSKFNFNQVLKQMQSQQSTLPTLLANQAQNYFIQNFNKESFDGKRWTEVNRRIPGTPEYKYPKTKRLSRRIKKILIGTGRLRREVANSIEEKSFKMIRLAVRLPYAAAQNDGTRNIPARTYMKQTAELTNMQQQLIKREIDKIWQV